MRSWIASLAFVLTLPALLFGNSNPAAAPVTVTVTALHGDGTPFPALWLALIPDWNASDVVSKTDAAGVVQFVVEPPAGSKHLFVKVAGLGDAQLVPINDRQSVRLQDKEVIPNYSFPTFLTIPLVEGVSEYATTITLHESVRVSAQLVDEAGQPIAGGVMYQINGIGMDADMHHDDDFDPLSIGGIRRGGSADVVIAGPTSPKPLVIHLEPWQTADDVDLGSIHIPPYQQGTVPLHLIVTGRDRLQTQAVEETRSAVTIFSADGQSAIIFAFNPATGEMADWPPGQPPRTPLLDPGTYYIAPGFFGASPTIMLRQLLLNGVDVDAAGVPKVVAVEGQEVVLTIDAAAAERAILTAAGQ